MIPKPLYEILPYVYFLVGSALWLLGGSPLDIAGGVLLYGAAAQQWVLRTNHRRPDRIRANILNSRHGPGRAPRYRRFFIPRGLYEALPFLYIAIGYSTAAFSHHRWNGDGWSVDLAWTLATAAIFTLTGFVVLLLRSRNRQTWPSYRLF